MLSSRIRILGPGDRLLRRVQSLFLWHAPAAGSPCEEEGPTAARPLAA